MNLTFKSLVVSILLGLVIVFIALRPFSNQQPITWIQVSNKFSIMKAEVTVSNFKQCVDKGDCDWPSGNKFCSFIRPDPTNLPMNCLSHSDALSFCRSIQADLPTVEEWESAARAGRKDNVVYPWGDLPKPNCDYAVKSNSPWITITSGNPSSGNGTVGIQVAARQRGRRMGRITIGGQAFTVIYGSRGN